MKLIGRKLLLAASDFPYPPNHGGRAATWGTIKTLASLGVQIDLVATTKTMPTGKDLSVVKEFVSDCIVLKREVRAKDTLSRLPLQIASRSELSSVNLKKDYDFLFLEGEYVWPILENPKLKAAHTVLRVHNDEATYHWQLGLSSGFGIRRFIFAADALKFSRFNRKAHTSVDLLLFISADEYKKHISRYPKSNAVWLPPAVGDVHPYQARPDSKTVLFIGALFMSNNVQAVQWYLDKVHPLLKDIEGYRFMVAGNSRDTDVSWIENARNNDPQVEVSFDPDDLTPIYEESAVFVNPMLRGAGVKIKTIEAIRNGLPVVSTNIGSEGTGLTDGEHIFITDNPAKFSGYVRMLLEDPEKRASIVQPAQDYLLWNYRHRDILEESLAALIEI